MTAITLEQIQAKQTELAKLIAQFQQPAQVITYIEIEEATIELQPGERYAGPVLDESGHLSHHLVLMAQRPDKKLPWQAALDWAANVGGTLPNRQEQALLFANVKDKLDPKWHWTSQVHEDDASYAWSCDFGDGGQFIYRKSYEGSAVAVRCIPLGD